MADHSQVNRSGRVSAPIILIGLAALIGFLILNGHGEHLLLLAPLLVLLACPLMHLFMHHGHRGHGANDQQKEERVSRLEDRPKAKISNISVLVPFMSRSPPDRRKAPKPAGVTTSSP